MEALKPISRNAWIVIGVIFLLVVITSYNVGKTSGVEKCKTV